MSDVTATATTPVSSEPTATTKPQMTDREFLTHYRTVQGAGGTRKDLVQATGLSYLTVCNRIKNLKKLAQENGIEFPELTITRKRKEDSATVLREMFGN